MKKRLISIMLVCLMVFAVLPMTVGAADENEEQKPKIEFETVSVTAEGGKKGSRITVEVSIVNNPGFVSATIPVSWESDELKLVSVPEATRDLVTNKLLKEGSEAKGIETCGWIGYKITEAVNEAGLYHLAWNYDTMYTGDYDPLNFVEDGLLCVMEFEILKDMTAGAAYAISADAENAFSSVMNWDMEDLTESTGVTLMFGDGGVELVDTEATYILGDVNGDKVVNTSDARYVLRYVVKYVDKDIEIWKGDVNKDEVVNTSDARYILRYVVKYQDGLGIGEEKPVKTNPN